MHGGRRRRFGQSILGGINLVERHLAEKRLAGDVNVEATAFHRLRLCHQQAWRAIALADRLELDRIIGERILDAERFGIFEVAQRHNHRHDALFALEIEPRLAPRIVVPQRVAIGPTPHRQHENGCCLPSGKRNAVAFEELMHLVGQKPDGELADVAARRRCLVLDRQGAEVGGDVLGLELCLDVLRQFLGAQPFDQFKEGFHLHISA